MLGKTQRGWLVSGWLLLLVSPAALRAEAPPVIERVEPSAGPPGTVLRITGRRLRGQTQVRIGDVPLSIELSTANLITARVEANVSSGPLRVVTAHGEVQGPDFTVTHQALAPSIERIQPLRAAAGSVLTIQGNHFSARASENHVLFGTASGIVESATATQLRVIVPEAATAGPISVGVPGASETRSAVAFEPIRRLSIREVVPPIAAVGDEIEVLGAGFAVAPAANRVLLGETPLRVLEASPTRLLVKLPPSAHSARLRLDVAGAGTAFAPAKFEVLAAAVVSGFTPAASALPVELRVAGVGFGRDPAAILALLGNAPLRVARVAPTELVLEVPEGVVSGKLSIVVASRGPALSAAEFIVTEPLRVGAAKPASGAVGSDVVLEGAGFGPRASDNRVWFGDLPGEVLSATPTRLTLRVPAAKSAPIRVEVGTSRAATREAFVITSPPRVARVSAEQLAAGQEFGVFGAGFGRAAALVRVTLDAQPLQIVSVRDDAIVVRAPDTAVGGELTVWVALQGRASYARPIQVTETP
jgi:hypothetical protein